MTYLYNNPTQRCMRVHVLGKNIDMVWDDYGFSEQGIPLYLHSLARRTAVEPLVGLNPIFLRPQMIEIAVFP
ncbi:MAG: hypothetical protein VXA00_01630 [Rhodospirillales bacterium]